MKILSKTYRPFVFILFFYVLGVIVGYYGYIQYIYIILMSFLFFVISLINFSNNKISSIFILLLFFCLGSMNIENKQYLKKDHIIYSYRYYRKIPVEIKGTIISDIQETVFFNTKKGSFVLNTESVKVPWGWKNISGKILVNVFRDIDVEYGDEVIITGKLHMPFEFAKTDGFSYRNYLRRKEILLILSVKKTSKIVVLFKEKGNRLKTLSIKIKNKLEKDISKYLSKNERGIVNAILLGDRSNIPRDIKQLFVRTGTVHVLAISGLHIGIIAGLLMFFLSLFPFGRKLKLLLTCILLIFYSFLTGGRPSVVRSTIMITVILAGYIVERETDVFNTTCFAALIISLYNPFALFDVGFQLSFICVISILIFSPILIKFIKKGLNYTKNYLLNIISQSISISLSVWLGIAGIIVYYFKIITPVTVLANLIVIPMLTIIVVLGCILLIFANISATISFFIAICLKMSLNLMAIFIFLFDKLPFSYIKLQNVIYWHIIVYYFVIFFSLFLFKIRKIVE